MTAQSPVLLISTVLPEVTIAKNQPEYLPLPALISNDETCRVTTRWKLSWKERLLVLLRGNVYMQALTFGNPLQPVKLMVDEPEVWDCL